MRGSRPGERRGGRQKGTKNIAAARRELETKLGGDTPLDFMLGVMRDLSKSVPARMEAAKAAAPFIHPKLAAVVQVVVPPHDLTKLSDEDLASPIHDGL
jgi:hypothetical protein